MPTNKSIESIRLGETSIIDILLTVLSKDPEYMRYFESLVKNISIREENNNV